MKYLLTIILLFTVTAQAQIQGQAQRQGQVAAGVGIAGADSMGNTSSHSTSNTTNVNQNTTYKRNPVSTAAAIPGAVAGGDLRCSIGIGAGIQAIGFGIAAAGVSTEENCVRLRDAVLARQFDYMGKGEAVAHFVMCSGEYYRRASGLAGVPCPAATTLSYTSSSGPLEIR